MKQDLFWYNACDVDATLRCYYQLDNYLTNDGLYPIFDLSMAVLPVLKKMTRDGVKVNTLEQTRYHVAYNNVIKKLEAQLAEHVRDSTFNWKSHKQLTELLYEKLHLPRVYSKYNEGVTANEDALKEIYEVTANPIVAILLKLRKASKLASTYFSLPATKITRVHSDYLLHGTATGRLSSRNPNLQNVPKGPARSIYVPEDDRVFVSADYNQIELRIAAILAGEQSLLDAFAKGEDVHKKTAAAVYHIAPAEVTEDQRFKAKMIVYGLSYGRGSRSLAREYKMTVAEADRFIDEYSQQFPHIWRWRQECLNLAKKQGYLANPFGRRRYFFGPNTAPKVYNYLPQSTAADVLLGSLVQLGASLPEGARLVLTVHDSIMAECSPEQQEQVTNLLRAIMERPIPELGNVSIPVKIHAGRNWSETD
jgi:DNA polymerase-1